MTTSLAERTDQKECSVKETLFVSKYPDHKLFMRQPNRTVEHGVVVYKEGRSIQFVNHEYRTSDPMEQDFLRNHRLFNTQIIEVKEGEMPRFGPEPVPMSRSVSFTEQTDGEPQSQDDSTGIRQGKVYLPCGFEDCTYVAEGDDEVQAQRRLNGHKTASGHRGKD